MEEKNTKLLTARKRNSLGKGRKKCKGANLQAFFPTWIKSDFYAYPWSLLSHGRTLLLLLVIDKVLQADGIVEIFISSNTGRERACVHTWEPANLKKLSALLHVSAPSPLHQKGFQSLLHEVGGATYEQKGRNAKQCWTASIRYLHIPIIYEWHLVHSQLHSMGPLRSKPGKWPFLAPSFHLLLHK